MGILSHDKTRNRRKESSLQFSLYIETTVGMIKIQAKIDPYLYLMSVWTCSECANLWYFFCPVGVDESLVKLAFAPSLSGSILRFLRFHCFCSSITGTRIREWSLRAWLGTSTLWETSNPERPRFKRDNSACSPWNELARVNCRFTNIKVTTKMPTTGIDLLGQDMFLCQNEAVQFRQTKFTRGKCTMLFVALRMSICCRLDFTFTCFSFNCLCPCHFTL